MGNFGKMRNAFVNTAKLDAEERERMFQEQKSNRIKLLLNNRKMQMDTLEDLWNKPGVKRKVKQQIIRSIISILEELQSYGYELSEEEMMVPVLPDEDEDPGEAVNTQEKPAEAQNTNNATQTPNQPTHQQSPVAQPTTEHSKEFAVNIFDIDDSPAIPITTNKPKKTSYDIVTLPSKGQCYPCKKENIAIAYLTAADENIIASPTLYKDGKIVDQLLYNNVIDQDFNPDDLCLGDADAIILWLRATGYGYDFPITVTDPLTGNEIKTSVDLSSIKTRPFKLVSDENGWFDFTLPVRGDVIKFKYITRAMDRRIHRAEQLENQAINQRRMEECLADMLEILSASKIKDTMPENEKQALLDGIKKWNESIDKDAVINYTKLLTNKMEVSIMAVNGNTDRSFIHDYIADMPARDSYAFRKYYNENEPGLDFEITIERPVDEKGLGGGSFTTFLPCDHNIFFNIGEL